MSYVFMAFHHPKPKHRNELVRGMVEMAELMAGTPGFIDAGPWVDSDRGHIVGISRWESREAFLAAVPPGIGVPSDEIHEWETRPRVLFNLNAAETSS